MTDKQGITLEPLQQIIAGAMLAVGAEPAASLDIPECVWEALRVSSARGRALAHFDKSNLFLRVDYREILERMIGAGNYDWRNDGINAKEFAIQREGIVACEAILFHFETTLRSEEVVQRMKETDPANPWEPAEIEQLLAFGMKYPEAQRANPIVGLGSITARNKVFGRHNVPYLYRWASGRSLHLERWSKAWRPNYLFLGVRQVGFFMECPS
jgi:hypothetical protein